MRDSQKFIRTMPNVAAVGLLMGLLLLAAGCETMDPHGRIVFTAATINGKPAKILLDTGMSAMIVPQSAASSFDLKISKDYTAPAKLTFGENDFTTPFCIDTAPWYLRMITNTDFDCLLSWENVRDNIVVFDADRHEVRALPDLPPETAEWVKLKVSTDNALILEMPQTDGSTGELYVDTGSPYGLSLFPAQWQEWDKAHPNAPSMWRLLDIANTISSSQEAWADEISLGPLNFTDVPVHEATDYEVRTFDHYAGTIGLYALERIDLIIDGKNGFAYLRPRPAPGPPYPGINRQGVKKYADDKNGEAPNWTVAGNVRLNFTSNLLNVAERKLANNDIKGALHDYTQVTESDPHNFRAFYNRAVAYAREDNMDGALADFTQCTLLDPANSTVYLTRGMIESYQGDYARSISDYNQAQELDPKYADGYYHRGVSKLGAGDDAGALADFEQAMEGNPGQPNFSQVFYRLVQIKMSQAPNPAPTIIQEWKNKWAQTLYQYLTGEIDEAALLAQAEKQHAEPPAGQKCEAYFFIGEMRLARGDKTGARDYLEKCVSTKQKSHNEYGLARAELARLDAAPAKSP